MAFTSEASLEPLGGEGAARPTALVGLGLARTQRASRKGTQSILSLRILARRV